MGRLAGAVTRRSLACGAALLIAAAALAGCGRKQTQAPATANQAPLPTARVDEARLLSSEAGGDMWLTTGGDFGKTHYSRLTDISRDNVARLGFAWEYQTNTNRGLEATPIVVDGVMYTSGIAGRVYALDARTGREIWTFQPNVDMQVNRSGCCDMVNRGVAVWHGKVYVAALDGWLYALDATDGTEAWRADTFADRGRGYTSTGAPQIAGDVVVIGNGGAEFDARGYVSAYDLESGIMRWRFFTVPGDPKNPPESPALVAAAKTWDANSNWDVGGGGTVWDALVYDPKLKLLYVGVGNGAPWAQQFRSPQGGDNLYLASILALDPADGTLVWHYQEVPGEQWDYTATQPMLLTDVEVNGTTVPVVMHAPKNGFAYVIDRRNGKVLAASKFARVNWATHVDLKTGRPAMDANAADYRKGPRIVFPSSVGAHNWNPMAWDPEQKVLYIPSADIGNLLFMPEHTPTRHAKGLNTGVNVVFADSVPGMLPDLPPDMQKQIRALPEMKNPGDLQPRGYLQAFDPITGKQRWAVPTSGWWGSRRRARDRRRTGVSGQRHRQLQHLRREGRQVAQEHRDRHVDSCCADDLSHRRRAVRGRHGGLGRRRLEQSASDERPGQVRQCRPHPRFPPRRRRHSGTATAAAARTGPGAAGAGGRRRGHRARCQRFRGELRHLPRERTRLARTGPAPHAGWYAQCVHEHRARRRPQGAWHAAVERVAVARRCHRDPRLSDRPATPGARGRSDRSHAGRRQAASRRATGALKFSEETPR